MDGNIYFLLLILFIFFIVIIITKLKSSKVIKEDFQEELIQMKALQDYAEIKKQEDLEKLPLITKIDVVKTNKDPKYPNKHLMLEGINLKKIENVYFGPLKGYIINKDNGDLEESENTITNSEGKEIKYNIIRIIPPDFVKFNKALKPKDYDNIEIKLELKDEGLNHENIADENKDLKLSENNKEYKIKIKNGEFKSIEDKGKILLKFKITSTSEKSIYEFKINGNSYKINKDKLIQLKIRNKNNPITFQVLDLGKNETINVEDIKIYNTSDDIEVLFPTGLFYRFDYATSGESLTDKDADSWSVFLNKRINSYAQGASNKEKDFVLTKDINIMYKDIQNIITPPEVKNETVNFDVTDLNYEELETTIKIKWKIPKVVNNYRFAFLISIRSVRGTFIYKKEQVPYNKNFYEFPTNKLVAGEKYEYSIQTYRTDKRKTVGNAGPKKFIFNPPDFDSYHSHLIDMETGKFKTRLNKDNADLIKTYYHLLEKNKSNMRGNMNNLEEHVGLEGKCMEEKLKQLNTSSYDNFDKTINQNLKVDKEGDILYNEKQVKQDNKIMRINQKIKELEKVQGKLKTKQDTNIKKLTSLNDGTKLAVKKINNNKFMVGLNQGCISVDKMGNYSNIPCNIFDKKQFFELDSIENDDEYNNLLSMNLQPKLRLEEKVDYPFTILKPNKSTKCVHIDNKSLQIKPCTDDKSIRYTSHFYNDKCKSDI